jgi:hypothetical protein
MKMFRHAALAALLAVGGCHLIDQRDFNPQAGKKPEPKVVASKAAPGPGALLTISYEGGEPAYAADLESSVKRALTLKPNVLFTVQTLVPIAADADAQMVALQAAAATGREIAEAIIADGADQGQIELAVRADPAAKAKLVKIFVH